MELEPYMIMAYFGAYSVAGWLAEVIVSAASKARFVNRGICRGPYCPLYGTIALIIMWATPYMQDKGLTAAEMLAAGTAVAYLTELVSAILTRLIAGKFYWTPNPLHIIYWGVLTLLMMFAIQPILDVELIKISPLIMFLLICAFILYFVNDYLDALEEMFCMRGKDKAKA